MTAARLLDVSRLVSRAGRMPTGVDRVEFSYLGELTVGKGQTYGLARTALGYVLLDQRGMAELAARVAGTGWGRVDLISRLNRRLSPQARLGQSFVRRHALARCSRAGLERMLARHLPDGFEYFNVGHSNLTQRTLQAIKSQRQSKTTILIHDTIPLDFPHYQRPGTAKVFEAKLRLAAAYADRIICTSVACLRDVTRHMGQMGRTPPMLPALLGVNTPNLAAPSKGMQSNRPYFVMLGTIEPRKNHAMILDIWGELGKDAPGLMICGARGWANADVFARLDAGMANVTELPDLTDGEIATLLAGSKGLLFPSFAEGFGLPPVEAATLGVPVICADLPACREILGNWPVYLDPNDRYQWENTVLRLAAETTPKDRSFDPPTWDSHFKLVFSEAE